MKECIAYLDGEENWHVVPHEELIRCKDCKYWDVSKSNIMNHTCYWGYFLKKEDDYCSWAKPKEEESK